MSSKKVSPVDQAKEGVSPPWNEIRASVEEKIQQGDYALLASKEGAKDYLGYPPLKTRELSLQVAIADCVYALGKPDVPAFHRKWFSDTLAYCRATLKEGAKP